MSKKYDLHVRIDESTQHLICALYRIAGCKSQGEYVEQAVRFYSGYIANSNSPEYVTSTVSDTVKRSISSFENRMAKLLFKYSVEQALMMNVVAAFHKVDQPKIDRMRGHCIEEVKRTRGRFDFDDAMKWQYGEGDE